MTTAILFVILFLSNIYAIYKVFSLLKAKFKDNIRHTEHKIRILSYFFNLLNDIYIRTKDDMIVQYIIDVIYADKSVKEHLLLIIDFYPNVPLLKEVKKQILIIENEKTSKNNKTELVNKLGIHPKNNSTNKNVQNNKTNNIKINNIRKKDIDKIVDLILDKINKSGLSSLTNDELDILKRYR